MTRESLPDERASITRKFKIFYAEDGPDGRPVSKVLKFYIKAGMYPDGRLGEIFITGDQIGGLIRGALDSFAMMFSIALQHGVPMTLLTEKLRHARFGPSGSTRDLQFPSCSSMFDLVSQFLNYKFPDGRLRDDTKKEDPTTS